MIIVDGHNVILNDKVDMEPFMGPKHFRPFLKLVDNFARISGEKIVVVLDWESKENLSREYPNITVRFLEGYPDADSIIREMVSKITGTENNSVVTNDARHIIPRARKRRWKIISSEKFARDILAAPELKQESKQEPDFKKNPEEQTEQDLDEMEKYFQGPRPKLK